MNQRLNAQSVGNKAGGVFAEDRRFAQKQITVVHQEINHGGVGIRTGNNFEQTQVAGRVEKVRPAEIPAKILATSLCQQVHRNARRVGRDERAGLAELLYPFVHRTLNIQPLNYHLDNPVVSSNFLQVIIEVSQFDPVRECRAVQRGRAGFEHGLEGIVHDTIPHHCVLRRQSLRLFGRVRLFWNNVQQQYVNADVGKVSRNAGPHNTGAKHGYTPDGTVFSLRPGFF